MGKILDIVNGVARDVKDAVTRQNGSSAANDGTHLGLTTPKTWNGNTAIGPAGGYAKSFATTTPSGNVTNVRPVTNSAPAPAKQSGKSIFGGSGNGGGGSKSTSSKSTSSSSGSSKSLGSDPKAASVKSGSGKVTSLAKGGIVRGCGCAKRGKTKGKMR